MTNDSKDDHRPSLELTGATFRVYRYVYRAGKPCGMHDIQRGLGLSSFSVALYHVRKLFEAGMIREDVRLDNSSSNDIDDMRHAGSESNGGEKRSSSSSSGYIVDKLLFDNMIRIRRSLIPIQVGYAIFFATALAILLLLLRPSILTGSYFFAIMIIAIAVGIFSYLAVRAASKSLLP